MIQLPCELINDNELIDDSPYIPFGIIRLTTGEWSACTTHNRLDIAFVGTFDEAIRSACIWGKNHGLTPKWKEPKING